MREEPLCSNGVFPIMPLRHTAKCAIGTFFTHVCGHQVWHTTSGDNTL